jgi:hypothetical protein
MTAAELRFSAEKAGHPKLIELVEAYLERLAILDWTNESQRLLCAHLLPVGALGQANRQYESSCRGQHAKSSP